MLSIVVIAAFAGLMLLVASLRQARQMSNSLAPTLAHGTRVLVSSNYFWAQGATGTVSMPPDDVKRLAPEWIDVARTFTTEKGRHVEYWVVFDEPQTYPDGDGPYLAAEIQGGALTPTPAPGGAVIERSQYFPPGELTFHWYENPKLGYRVEFRMMPKKSANEQ